jgi:uncharacterized protein (TIGR00255 family)
MTGFGSAALRGDDLEASATVRSVNHRFLDVSVHLPRRLLAFEPDVRRSVQARLQRGKVEVSLVVRFSSAAGDGVRAADSLVASLVATLRGLKEAHRLAGDLSVSDVARFPGAIEPSEALIELGENGRLQLLSLVSQALDQLEAMSREEGQSLRTALTACLDQILAGAARIEALARESRAARVEALHARVRELVADGALDEARLHQEVVRLVDRSDVSEELVRLRSHVAQCKDATSSHGPSGKRLDFLAQELAREANTIGSKAVSAPLLQEVIGLKTEIERFREQVQNVE